MTTAARTPTSLTTAAQALHGEEVERTRAFIRLGWIAAVGAAIATAIVPGDPRIATALYAVLAIGVVGSIWVYREIGDRARYRPSMTGVIALAAIVCGQLGILYVGIGSAAPLVVALGVYFFCRTESLAAAIAVFAFAAGSHAVEATLLLLGVIRDPGFAPLGAQVTPIEHLAGQIMIQLMYLSCFVLARATRTSSLRAIEQLQQTTRLAAQRAVQLAELRHDLDRALKIGGAGRFTGHQVGAWTLGNLIGRGAMGEVYEAQCGATEGAVKLLRRELLADAMHVERFLREVRVASSLDSPHVVRVLAASTPEDAIPFLAMERLHGRTLAELLRQDPLAGPRLLALVEQVGGVLERAREAGIVHRDLKPHNLFCCDDGTWKVLDFGVALLGDSGTLTQGAVIGTPTYMAPEQAKGEQVDHRADVYALGGVIYRCLTGRVPFAARDTPSLLYSVVHTMPMRPSAIGAVTSAEEAVLAVAMAKSRAARFQTAGELVACFRDAERGTLSEAVIRRAQRVLRDRPWREPNRSAS